MRPLQAIAMGLVIVVLAARVGDRVDVFPDPLGWLLVVYGARSLPSRIALRPWLLALAVVAGVVSVPLWLPGVAEEVTGADEALLWALDLPQLLFVVVLALAMARAAGAGEDLGARAWWRFVLVGSALTLVLPAVVFGAQQVALAVLAAALAVVSLVACLVLCFAHSARPWVHDPGT